MQLGDSFDMATLAASLLIGSGYDAYIVMGLATRTIARNSHTQELCYNPSYHPESHSLEVSQSMRQSTSHDILSASEAQPALTNNLTKEISLDGSPDHIAQLFGTAVESKNNETSPEDVGNTETQTDSVPLPQSTSGNTAQDGVSSSLRPSRASEGEELTFCCQDLCTGAKICMVSTLI